MAHPDEAVKVEHEEPSKDMAVAKLRHEEADSEWATPQEKKQAAVEKAHALSTRPDGSYAQLHETEEATLAVADDGDVKKAKEDVEEAKKKLAGEDDESKKAAAEQAKADKAEAKAAK
jgi:hypothetical protein